MQRKEYPIPAMVDPLTLIYLNKANEGIKEGELDATKMPLTEALLLTLKFCTHPKHKRLINIAIRGQVRTGKSTVAIKIASIINQWIQKRGYNPKAMEDMKKLIFGDQIEFNRFTTEGVKNVCVVIDEFNRLGQTGENATTEQALLEHYSNVFAVRYVHRVTASPSYIVDRNAWIILDVMGQIPGERITRCKLLYRDIVNNRTLVLGHVDLYVGDLIDDWERVIKPIIDKENKTKEEKKMIEKWKEQDMYIEYQVKKRKRLELLEKHGVRDVRELEYAEVILRAVKELSSLVLMSSIKKGVIKDIADQKARELKRIYSIVARTTMADKIQGILDIMQECYKRQRKLETEKLKRKRDQNTIGQLEEDIEKLENHIKERLTEHKELARLYKEYINIK